MPAARYTESTVDAQTPMMRQYFAAKAEHPGVLLAMRVGDFYEFYGPDAEAASAALEITLTGKEDGSNGRLPMAGVPHHSVEKYLARLLAKGIKVALCEQLEDPKAAKGLVKRGITRVLTPGTVLEDSMLPGAAGNYLAGIVRLDGTIGFASIDPSTGEFAVTEFGGAESHEFLTQELARIRPREVLLGPDLYDIGEIARITLGAAISEGKSLSAERAHRALLTQLKVASLHGFGLEKKTASIQAAAMVLHYVQSLKLPLEHVESLLSYDVDRFMRLDAATRRSLELTTNMADGGKRLTLLEVLDGTRTSMGSRLLKKWIEQPLLDIKEINGRLDAIELMRGQNLPRADLRETLAKVSDLERLVSRVSTGIAGPRDCVALRTTLLALPLLNDPLRLFGLGRVQELREQLGDFSELGFYLQRALVDEPPHSLRDGGVLRAGFDDELDQLRTLGKSGKGYIAGLELAEREKTGINNLKVGFNSVFGYYIEVPKAQITKVPSGYIRKQTTANAERYITAELKDHESQVLGAEEKALALEAELFQRVKARIAEYATSLLATARALAELDVLSTLAEVSVRRNYCKPELASEDVLEIEDGRHPVVEGSGEGFVPNDTELSDGGTRVMIITGPNMAGKSTYLRQNALIVLMAQIGCFVPASRCRLGLSDRIFARIGARDELALGQSTFMVEMVESANILNHATAQSLVILDEVGRGTSTYDGLAIAWAMVEHLADVGAKTLFATHYHQLNQLAAELKVVTNWRVAVEERGDDLVWTHRVLAGGTDRSYGIHVAKLAGVPPAVLRRAEDVLRELESKSSPPSVKAMPTQKIQMTLFEAEAPPVVEELQNVDVNALTPIEALRLVDEWKRKYAAR